MRRYTATSAVIALLVLVIGSAVLPAVALGSTGKAQTFVISGVNNIDDVSGDVAVCTTYSPDYREGRTPAETSIVAVNLTTGAKQRLVTHSSRMLEVTFSGRYAVWYDERAGEHIWAYDLLTDTEFPVAKNAGHQEHPGVDGDYAVWTDEVAPATGYYGHIHIEGMNLRTGDRFIVSTGPGYQYEPRVSNGWVVYTDVPTVPSKAYIRAYQISTGRTYTLNPKPGYVANPDIGSSGIAVWTQQNKSGTLMNSYMCSVYDRRVSLIQAGTGFGGGPRVDGNVVAFPQPLKHGFQIEGYDTLGGTKFTVAPSSGVLGTFMPIDDGRVAWIEQNPKTFVDRLCVGSPTVIGTYSATDIYATAVAQSRLDFPDGADTVVLANGANWDEVVVASGLAGTDSPVLLTGRDALPSVTAAELARLAPKHVLVVGGPGSVSDAGLAQIALAVASTTTVERTGGGASNGDTALHALGLSSMALTATSTPGPYAGTVIVVSGLDHMMSGIVTPVLRADHIPVVFARTGFSASESARLTAAGVKRAIIVGGKGGVNANAEKELRRLLGTKSVLRIAGKDGYDTSARFNEYAIRHLGMRMNGVGIAAKSATNDVLMAGVGGGAARSLLLLTSTKKLTVYASRELKARRGSIHRALYVGRGSRLVSRGVRKAVRLIVR